MRRKDIVLITSNDDWPTALENEARYFKDWGINFDPSRYLCSGFCFFNLKRFRDYNLDKACIDFAIAHPNTNSVDQSVLAAVVCTRDDCLFINRKWQTFTRDLTEEELAQRPMLHYAGEAPWVCLPLMFILNEPGMLWFRFYASCRGITVWRALREFYSAWRIVLCRIMYIALANSSLLHSLLNFHFRLVKHDASILIIGKFLHKVRTCDVKLWT